MEEPNNPLQHQVNLTLTSLRRFEQHILELRKKIVKQRLEKSSLEDSIQQFSDKLEELALERNSDRLRLEKVRATIVQIETFRLKMSETFDAMLSSVRKERDLLDG